MCYLDTFEPGRPLRLPLEIRIQGVRVLGGRWHLERDLVATEQDTSKTYVPAGATATPRGGARTGSVKRRRLQQHVVCWGVARKTPCGSLLKRAATAVALQVSP